jgi:hypothetical protein
MFWHLAPLITTSGRTTDQALADVRGGQRSLDELGDRFEKLLLIRQAMWSLMIERTSLTEKDLIERVTQIDLQDGRLDGKVTKPIVNCSKCKGTISPKFNRCLWCGEPVPAQPQDSAFSDL